MEKLNVTCSICKIGKLTVAEQNHDDYMIGCTDCNNLLTVSYNGFDSINRVHRFNEQMNEDVQVLNKCGVWKWLTTIENFNMAGYTRKMKHLQTIEDHCLNHYYQSGGAFYAIRENKTHNTFEVFKYKVNKNSIATLINHFC